MPIPYYHIIEYGNSGDIAWQGYETNEEVANARIEMFTELFSNCEFELYVSDSPNEPPITTV